MTNSDSTYTSPFSPGEWAVLIFTIVYAGGFFVYFLQIGNREFIWYILTLAAIAALIGVTRNVARYPVALLWALSIWGLLHMSGGSIRVGDSVLYNFMVVPVTHNGELSLLKFDQIVHFYGFGITAWLLWHLLYIHFEALHGTWTIHVYPALASMGLGATNEIIEFTAVLAFPNTNVGGYFNTSLDLVLNALGAIVVMIIIYFVTVQSETN